MRKINVGIIANEFFDENIGGFGGFGWLAREAYFCIKKNFENANVVFLCGNFSQGIEEYTVYGAKVIFPDEVWIKYLEKVQAEQLDILLSIDYRPNYDYPLAALPTVPLIMWIQDPRPPEDIQKINSLFIPGYTQSDIAGIKEIDCTTWKEVVQQAQNSGAKIVYACPAPGLIEKVPGTFGITLRPDEIEFLPYPLVIEEKTIKKSIGPKVLFLGRLDPIKRPWVFTELAKTFPDVEFILTGKAHFGEGAWLPDNLPDNVNYVGHIDGTAKETMLSECWILINPSIHEALPVSFLEALQFEMCILSCQNPENIVAEYGFYTGRHDESGLQGLPKYISGLNHLLNERPSSIQKGKKGRKWVEENHTNKIFIDVVKKFCDLLVNEEDKKNGFTPPFGFPRQIDEIYQTTEEIKIIVQNKPFLLIDDYQLPSHQLSEIHFQRFREKAGYYYGPPETDEVAIKELNTQISNGYKYLAVTAAAYWWLDHYFSFNQFINDKSIRHTGSERVKIFEFQER